MFYENVANEGFSRGKDPVNIVLALLKELSIPLAAATVREELRSHPDYPSMFCIVDSLRRWGLETLALEVPYSGSSRLPCPFLAHCPVQGEDPYLVIREISDGRVHCVDGGRKRFFVAIDKFYGIWDGKVLLIGKGEAGGVPESASWWKVVNRSGVWQVLLAIAICMPLFIGAGRLLTTRVFSDRVYFLSLLFGSSAGMMITLFLLRYDYGLGGERLRRWCSLNGRMSCTAVLRSRLSRPWRGISWSELGFIYFAGSLLYSWLGQRHAFFPGSLVFLQLMAPGYIVFSLVYQAFFIRKWCVLCLVVQALFLGQALAAMGTGQVRMYFRGARQFFSTGALADGGVICYAFLIAGAGLIILKRYWLGSRELAMSRQGLNRLKRNELVFETLLGREDVVPKAPPAAGLFLGNRLAEHSLLLVTNPDCPPCARAYRQLEALLKVNPRWKAQVIYMVAEGQEQFLARLADERCGGAEIRGDLAVMRNWCEQADIRATPAIFANGRRLPEQYEIEDLQFL